MCVCDICMYVVVCMWLYVYMYVRMYVCVCVYVCINVCGCTVVCMHVCMFAATLSYTTHNRTIHLSILSITIDAVSNSYAYD